MVNIKELLGYPKFEDIRSALFIQPHPDDNEIGAGGTMAKLVKMGIPVYGLTVTEGRGGSNIYAPEKLAEIRKIEAANAMDILGVINLGCLKYKLTPEEVLTAVTLNAAAAIGLADKVGSVEPGKQGDLVIWDAPDQDYICYRMGSNLAQTVIKKGAVV